MEKAANASNKAKWTVMVYMAGDNNLDGAALRDIAEMAKVGSTKDVNVLVQLDRIEDKLTRRFRITKGGGFKKDCIESFGDTNTGDPQILYDFVRWAADNYPADRHCLILWNHGSGWWEEEEKSRAAGPGRQKARHLFRHALPQAHRSICYDDTSGGDALDNRELKVVLTGICTLLGKKIDLLGMDACLMNMVEVAYQLQDSVNYIVGSEIEEPFDGWPYTEILTYLTSKPAKDTATFAKEIVKRYVCSYQGKNETVTQSALDVSRIAEMTAKVDALSEILLTSLEADAKLIEAAWTRSPRFYDDNYIDLACFIKNLRKKTNADIRAKADDLLAALKAGIIYLKRQYDRFPEIPDYRERLKFALASYNGGRGYINQAVALARKEDAPWQTWEGVKPYLAKKDCIIGGKHPDHRQIIAYVGRIWADYLRLTNPAQEVVIPAQAGIQERQIP